MLHEGNGSPQTCPPPQTSAAKGLQRELDQTARVRYQNIDHLGPAEFIGEMPCAQQNSPYIALGNRLITAIHDFRKK